VVPQMKTMNKMSDDTNKFGSSFDNRKSSYITPKPLKCINTELKHDK